MRSERRSLGLEPPLDERGDGGLVLNDQHVHGHPPGQMSLGGAPPRDRPFVPQGEILDQFPSKEHSVFLVQSPKLPTLPNTVLQGPIYGVGIFRDERRARTLAKHLAQT
jgi:hypothetical protein